MKIINLYTDAGYKKLLKSPVYAGWVCGETAIVQEVNYKPTSSTEAEYIAMIEALLWLSKRTPCAVNILNDNQNMICQINGKYDCHVPTLQMLLDKIDIILISLENRGFVFTFKHIPRKLNKADEYVQKAKKSI